jgi:hypothetical protein
LSPTNTGQELVQAAQNALGGVIEAGPLRLWLQPFGVGDRLVVDEVGKDRPVLVEERLYGNGEVLQHS